VNYLASLLRRLGPIDLRQSWPQRRLEHIALPMTGSLALIGVLAVLVGTIEAAILVIVASVATSLAELGDTTLLSPLGLDGVSPKGLIAIGVGLIGCYAVVEALSASTAARLISRTTLAVRERVLDSHAAAAWVDKEQLEGTALVQLATMNAMLSSNMALQMASFTTSILNFAALIAAALIIDPIAAMLVVIGVGGLIAISLPLTAVARTQQRASALVNRDFVAAVQEHSALSREVEVFDVHEESLRPIEALSRRHSTLLFRSTLLTKLNTTVYKASALLLILVLLFVAVAVGTNDVAAFAGVASVLLRSVSYGQGAQRSWHTLGENTAWLDQLEDDLERLEREPPVLDLVDRSTATPTKPISIEFEQVSFAYTPAAPVLTHASASIDAGAFVGLIGPSGSGKSTLADLLLGLRAPQSGTITARSNGISLTQAAWRASVAFVRQEPLLIAGSIIDNVRFYRPWITDDAVRDALRAAHILEEALVWPEGLETDPGTLGHRLSGGQKQRIAIARAIAGNPRLLILDEPTSALDPRSEQRVTETIDELRGTTTIVVIAHRLSTIERADLVLRIEDGDIVATALGHEQQTDRHRQTSE